MIRFFIWHLVALILFSCSERVPQNPNILFIMLDDLGKEWVSAYGADDIETPNIDRLAATGMLFDNAYCMPQCTPSRITLLTGQYPFRHGWVNHWDVPRWGGGCHFDPEKNPSVARIMQSAGYVTAAAGKWQVNDFRVQPDIMTQHGFDAYCMWTGFETGNLPSAERYWHPYLFTRSGSQTYAGRFSEDVFSDFLINFMAQNREKPMFIYYPMCLTHTPMTSTPLEPGAQGKLEQHEAMVRYADHLVGRLVAALDSLAIRERTIVVLTTDNGTNRSITGRLFGRDVTGGKSQTTENGICVPFIANGPGLVPQGVKTDALTDFTDMLPTFAELAGATLPDDVVLDGVSIADVLLGNTKDSQRQWILAMGGGNKARLTDAGVENMYVFRDRVIRDKQYKLYVDSHRKPVSFFDLAADPGESCNLIDSLNSLNQTVFRRLSDVMRQFPDRDNDPIYAPLPPQPWDVPVTAKSQVWKR
jgi:arylsulfatase A-like enzyme